MQGFHELFAANDDALLTEYPSIMHFMMCICVGERAILVSHAIGGERVSIPS